MGAVQLYGWSPDDNKWVKLQLDSDGSIHIVGYVDNLEDIGDVILTAIANNDILFWNAGEEEWQNIAHLGVADAHHARYTDADAVDAMGAKADDNPLHHDRAVEYTDGDAVSAVNAAGVALADGKSLRIYQELLTDETWSGLTAIFTAGIALTIYQAVYVGGDGKMEKARADAAAYLPAIALATTSIAENAKGTFLLQGFFRNDAWAWTPGGLLYVSETTGGALTQTLPAGSGEQVQVVGVAITADIIYFNPSYELVEIS